MPGLLRRRLPDRAARSRAARQAPARGPGRRGLPARAGPDLPRRPEDRDERHHARDETQPGGTTYAAAGVDIEAGDRAVELMKACGGQGHAGPRWSAGSAASPGCSTRARSPATGGRCWPPPPTAWAPRSRSRSALDVHDTIGIDLVGMVVDDLVVCGAEPLFMTDYIVRRQGGAGADRRDRARHRRGLRAGRLRADRRRDGRAPRPAGAGRVRRGRRRRPAWWRRTRCSARSGCASRRRRARHAPPRGCTPTATRWCGTCCSRRRAGSWTGRCRSSAARSARSCWSRPGSTRWTAWSSPAGVEVHAFAHVTGGGLAANLARVLPAGLDARLDRVELDAAAGLRPGRRGRRGRASRSWSGR